LRLQLRVVHPQFVLDGFARGDIHADGHNRVNMAVLAGHGSHTVVDPGNRAVLADVALLHLERLEILDATPELVLERRQIFGVSDIRSSHVQQFFPPVADDLAKAIINHQEQPVHRGFGDAGNGLAYDSAETLVARAERFFRWIWYECHRLDLRRTPTPSR
jgi:hypothetical protein